MTRSARPHAAPHPSTRMAELSPFILPGFSRFALREEAEACWHLLVTFAKGKNCFQLEAVLGLGGHSRELRCEPRAWVAKFSTWDSVTDGAGPRKGERMHRSGRTPSWESISPAPILALPLPDCRTEVSNFFFFLQYWD
jgi:hypothetical protein